MEMENEIKMEIEFAFWCSEIENRNNELYL